MKDSIVLITGGCGFIGTSLIARLVDRFPSVSIRVLDNLQTGTPEDLAEVVDFDIASADSLPDEGICLIRGDVRDADTLELSAAGADCIVHLAANTGVGPSVTDPRTDMACNVIGTFNALEAARRHGVPRFVFASSGAPAGEVEPPIHEEVPPHPVSPYGASKLAGEGYCSAYYRTYGVGTICLRFGNVYGPRSKHKASVIAKFIKAALSNEACRIFGDGLQTRDFIFIDDLTRAIELAMSADCGGETFQIASGKERTVREVAETIAHALETQGVSMEIEHEEPRLGDVKRNYSDTTKAARVLGWQQRVSLEEGISRTVDYFLENLES